MTAFHVQADTLIAHGKGSREAAGNFDSLARLLEQARLSDDCFGPIGELLAFTYFDGLRECQGLATKAKSYLEQVAELVTTTAKTYSGTDSDTEGSLGALDSQLAAGGTGPGSLADLNSAGDGQRKSFLEQHAGYGSSWVSTSGDVARASSPPDIAIATVNARMEQLQLVTSPGQSFIDNGLGFLIGIVISPIVEFVLEPAIGDPEQMRSTAQGWSKVAEWLEGTGEREKARAAATEGPWQGEAGEAFRQQMTEFGDGAAAFASEVRGLQQILEISADLFDAFVEIAIDMLQELVLGLIIEWLAALAASWITAGASTAAAGAATVGQTASTSARLALKVKQLLGKLKPLIDRLEDILHRLRTGPLKQVVERMEGLRDGNWVQKQIAKRIDQNPLAEIVTKADPATGLSKTGNKFADRLVPERSMSKAEAAALGDRAGETITSDQKGTYRLAANLSDAGLRMAGMSGTTDAGRALSNAAMENLPGEVAEQAVKYGYNKMEDPSTEDKRRDATGRGFDYK